MSDIERTKWLLCGKVIDLVADVKRLEENMDRIQKINIFLVRRYYDELAREFGTEDSLSEEILDGAFKSKDDMREQFRYMRVFDAISKKMNEEMPEPWYCYGIDYSKSDA